MKEFNSNLGRIFLIFQLLIVQISPDVWADNFDSKEAQALLAQSNRPKVQDVMTLLKNWNPEPLAPLSLKADRDMGQYRDLQHNYPKWFSVLITHGPKIIATFEKSFPGATWAFIGRDMDIFADLFEAYYLGIGQTDRVVRIGMSGGTLEELSRANYDDATDRVMKYLEAKGLDLTRLTHPFIFVDTLSKGSGRQGRFLIESIYKKYIQSGKESVRPLLWYVNFLGLRVQTTKLDATDFTELPELLSREQLNYKPGSFVNESNFHQIYVYDDDRGNQYYLGANEAGYSHWTGTWHESYGPFKKVGNTVIATPGRVTEIAERMAVLNYQAHVVQVASSKDFTVQVQEEAHRLGYLFPMTRPTYLPNPSAFLSISLETVNTCEQMQEALASFHRGNYNRLSYVNILNKVVVKYISLFELDENALSQLKKTLYTYPELVTGEGSAESFNARYLVLKNIMYPYVKAQVRLNSQLSVVRDAAGFLTAVKPIALESEANRALVKKYLPEITKFAPSVPQLNEAIDICGGDVATHEKILIRTFKANLIQTEQQFHELEKLNSWTHSSEYRQALQDLRASHPELKSKSAWQRLWRCISP